MKKYIDKEYDRHLDDFDDDFEVIYDALDELDDCIDYDSGPDDSDSGDDIHFERKQEEETPKMKQRQSRNKGQRNLPNLLSPAAKAAKAGGKAAGGIIRTVLRAASSLLIAAITLLLTDSFWKGHAVYGNPAAAVAEKNYALAAYFGFAALLLLFELIAFFWTLSGPKIKDGRRVRKLDTGRGIFSFLIIYAGSFLSAHMGSLIPDAPQALNGLKGAVTVYGSLNQTLFILCVAGIISCLLRKFIFH